MEEKTKTVFPGNNSAEGFASFYESGLGAMERIYILKGGPGTGKSSLMRRLGRHMEAKGYETEYWQCSSDNDSLDGVLVPALSLAMIDGTAPHVVDPKYPGVRETILYLGDFWDEKRLDAAKEDIIALTDRIAATFACAYEHLAEAAAFDDKALVARGQGPKDEDIRAFLDDVFGEKGATVRHLFAAAVTPEGVVDHTFDLCRRYRRRFFLLGKRGLGQQRYLRSVAAFGERRAMTIEVYHGCLRKDELKMVAFPDDDIVIAAVEALPAAERRADDGILRFQGRGATVSEVEAEKNRDEAIAAAVAKLREAHLLHDDLEAYYIAAMDFPRLDRFAAELIAAFTDAPAGTPGCR